jgi:hypothetical protein
LLLAIVQPLICNRRNTPIVVMPDLIWHPEWSSMPANFGCASSRRCFCLLLPSLVFTSVVVVRLLAGGRPATTYLFCFAKKGNPKKAPQSELTP